MSEELKFEEEQIKPIHKNDSVEGFSYKRYDPRLRIPTFVRFLMRTHIAKNERSAEKILLTICVLLILVAIVLFVISAKNPAMVRLQLTI